MSVAFGLTWLVWLPYLWAARSGRPAPDPFLFYLTAGGPFVGALVAERHERGWPGVRDVLRRLIAWRQPGWWLVVGVGSPLLLIPLAVVPGYLVSGTWPAWDGIGVSTSRAPGLGPLANWLLMIASYGVGEETGWRGFMLPKAALHAISPARHAAPDRALGAVAPARVRVPRGIRGLGCCGHGGIPRRARGRCRRARQSVQRVSREPSRRGAVAWQLELGGDVGCLSRESGSRS